MGALEGIGAFLMAPIATHALTAKLMGTIGKFRESEKDGHEHDSASSNQNVSDLN